MKLVPVREPNSTPVWGVLRPELYRAMGATAVLLAPLQGANFRVSTKGLKSGLAGT